MLSLLLAVLAQGGTFDGRMIERQFPRGDPPAKPGEIQKNKPIIKSDVEVDVVWAAETPVTLLMNKGFHQVTGEPYLTVVLRIVNKSPTKRLAYKGWHGLLDAATVTDDVGNTYTVAKHDQGTWVDNAVIGGQMLYPKDSVIDVLTFDRPVDAAKSLTLKLAGSPAGLTDDFTFEMPMSFVPNAAKGEVIDSVYFLANPKGAVERRKRKGIDKKPSVRKR
jgi:hypothetical protein